MEEIKALGEELGVSGNTVAKIWRNYCFNDRRLDYSRKLSDGDLELIEMLKTTQGSIQLREIYTTLEDVGDIAGGVSMSTISRAVKSRLLSGKQYTRKRITHVAKERFTNDNMIYTQLYINYLSSKDPKRIKFFDEAGVKTPDIGTRLYGNAPSGERCVEIARKTESPNFTLNLLISLNGPEYFNILNGATDTINFLNLFWEASQSVNELSGRPCLEVGDIVVMDNLAVHHYDGGLVILEEFLDEMGKQSKNRIKWAVFSCGSRKP